VAERLVAERTGIELSDGLRERLAAWLYTEATARDQTPARLAASLAGDPGAFQEVVDRVTVKESGFFRHPDQFAALAREVLPELEGPVVVWSAGCANGQEAYSLAMELAASGVPDWQVVATDISAAAVARARAGRYSTAELTGLPAAHRHWLRPAADLWEVHPSLRARVRVEQANLTTRFPVEPGRCQVVFCRNMLIYLSRTVAESFLDRLAGWLAPGGLVFLGYSEAVLAPTPACASSGRGHVRAPGSPGEGSRGRGNGTRGAVDSRRLRFRQSATLPHRGARRGTAGSGTPDSAVGAEPPGSSTPGSAGAMAAAGELAAGRGGHAGAVAAFRRRSSWTPTSRPPGSSSGWPSGRSTTGGGRGGRTRPRSPPSNDAPPTRSRPGSTAGRRTSSPMCSGPS
jgi:chemotaxis methyl-accepting protein methylase